MSEEKVIQHCSPTLAGLKSAAMFSTPFTTKSEAIEDLYRLNDAMRPFGLKVLLLRYRCPNALVYIYRPEMLSQELESPAALELLRSRGYSFSSIEDGVEELKEHVEACPSIPHEIGLFLGYPPEDVRGFIENKACCYKCRGYWKVYGDEHKAKCLFSKYFKCTQSYMERYKNGAGLVDLIIPA